MNGGRWRLLAVLLPWIGACHPSTLADAERSSETAIARQVLDAVARGDVDTVVARMPPERQTPEMKSAARKIAAYLPAGPPAQVRLLGWNVNKTETEMTEVAQLSFEMTYPSGWYFVQMDFRGSPWALELTRLNVDRLPGPLAVVNAFTLRGRTARHYLFLLMMAAAAGTVVTALRRWYRIRGSLRHRWWWLVGILALPISASLDWTNGEISYRVPQLRIGLVLEIVRASIDGPWIFTFSVPIGAIVFLILWRRPMALALPATAPQPPR